MLDPKTPPKEYVADLEVDAKRLSERLLHAEHVCAILLHNNYTHRFESEESKTLLFQDCVLGHAMRNWWLAAHPGGSAEIQPFKQVTVDELFGHMSKVQKWSGIAEKLCKLSDHDCCIFCNEVFPKSKPEPRCKCVAVDANGRMYER